MGRIFPIQDASSKLVFPPDVEKLVSTVVIRSRHKNARGPIQITIVRRGGIHKFLRGRDAMFFEHHHEHLCIDDGTGVKQFHVKKFASAIRN